MAWKSDQNTITLNKLLGEINSLIASGKHVRRVDVHAVGIERRLGSYSLEEIVGGHYTWYGPNRIRYKLTREVHDELAKVMDEDWHSSGKQWEKRGIY